MNTRDYIGFATLPEQVHRKSVKKGFEFTLMVAGDSGLGKSTLINSLFLTDLYNDRVIPPVQDRIEMTTAIEERTVEIEEKGVKLRLTVVDTPGFGDSLQSEGTCQALSDYIDAQFRHYFTAESGLHRKAIQDRRVNACLYFIPPYGHGLRQLDAEVMLRLHRKVNLVPIIAKADTLTPVELSRLKRQVLADLEHYRIQVYQLPECDSEEDEEFLNQDRELKAALPFAIVASTQTFEIAGKTIRGRQYPWGIVEVDNALHSDFVKLRTMLISTHMADLKEITNDHYEQFRAQCIAHISQQAIKERGKLKRDSMNVECVTTDALLQEKEEEIRRMQDMLAAMQQQLSQAQLKQSTSSTPNSPNMVRV